MLERRIRNRSMALRGPNPLRHDILPALHRRHLIATAELVLGVEVARAALVVLRTVHTIAQVRVAEVTEAAVLHRLFALVIADEPPDTDKGRNTADRRAHADDRVGTLLVVLGRARLAGDAVVVRARGTVGAGVNLDERVRHDAQRELTGHAVLLVERGVGRAHLGRERVNQVGRDVDEVGRTKVRGVTLPAVGDRDLQHVGVNLVDI